MKCEKAIRSILGVKIPFALNIMLFIYFSSAFERDTTIAAFQKGELHEKFKEETHHH